MVWIGKLAFILFQVYLIWYHSYFFLLGIASLYYRIVDDKKRKEHAVSYIRFAILVPARNEARTIGFLLDSLRQQEYPKELYRVYVIADHCEDETRSIVEAKGFKCLERYSGKKSKGAALEWFFRKASSELASFDVVVILDADNLASQNYLRALNEEFSKGKQVVVSKRVAKNPDDSWMSLVEALVEIFRQNLEQPGRKKLGLSNIVIGSGMAFEVGLIPLLRNWGADSTAEDLEWQLRLALEGIKISWSDKAILYDEKACTSKQSNLQRQRWLNARLFLARRYVGKLLVAGVKTLNFDKLDQICQLALIPRPVVWSLTFVMTLIAIIDFKVPWLFRVEVWYSIGIGCLFYYIGGLALDRAPRKMYLSFLYFCPVLINSIVTILKSRFGLTHLEWVPTKHFRACSLDELRKESRN